jgi:hypothetical protein
VRGLFFERPPPPRSKQPRFQGAEDAEVYVYVCVCVSVCRAALHLFASVEEGEDRRLDVRPGCLSDLTRLRSDRHTHTQIRQHTHTHTHTHTHLHALRDHNQTVSVQTRRSASSRQMGWLEEREVPDLPRGHISRSCRCCCCCQTSRGRVEGQGGGKEKKGRGVSPEHNLQTRLWCARIARLC